jgi:hypothetical protein
MYKYGNPIISEVPQVNKEADIMADTRQIACPGSKEDLACSD